MVNDMTVNELFELCKQEIENGNGDRNIVLCVNGDEFHPLENYFSSPVYNDSAIYDLLEEWEEEEDNVIVLCVSICLSFQYSFHMQAISFLHL